MTIDVIIPSGEKKKNIMKIMLLLYFSPQAKMM